MDAEGVVEERHEYSPNINILVVDDDITTLNIVSAMLKTWSYQVVTVRNPIEALAILRKGKYSFDLVVTDLHMPQMNGLELQKLVHEEFELPVIMMSADDKESVIMKSLEGGVVCYIVKPVSKDDIKMVWQYVVQSRKSRFSNVTIEEMMEGAPGEFAPAQKLQQGPGELKDLDCVTSFDDDVNYKEGHRNDQSSKRKMTRKRDRDMEDEGDDDGEHGRRLLATKKSKVVWTNSLHNQFLMAIRHIGLDKAVPKRILEFMNVPGLTRENVASHLQKYRMFLKRVAEKARLSKCLSERVLRSNLLYSLPTTPSFNSVQREQYAEYLKQQLQMNDLGLAPPLQNTLAPLSTASHLGSSSFRFPLNYNQQPADLNLASSSSGPHYHQLFGPGQSRLLMNNAPHQQRPMQLGNGMNLFSQANRGSGFGMQTMNNNVGHIRGYGGLMNNNDGNCFMNGGTNWMQMYSQRSQAKQQQQTLNFTSNPFNFGATTGISSPSIDNMMNPFNNVNLGTNFRGRSSQPAGGLNNFINGGYGNGLVINNEVINGLTNGVRNVNLNGSTFNAPTQGTTIGNSSPTFETNSANQFASILPRHNQQQPNQYGMSSTVGGGNNEFSFSSLRNTTSNFNNISLADDDDDIMVINNILLQQLDNCQPPSHQKQGGEEVPVNFTSMLYQDEDPEPTLTPTVDKQVQPNNNHAATGQVQMNSNHVANSQVQLNPNPSVNGEVQLNPNPFVIGQVQLNPDPFGNAKVQLNPNPIVNDQDQLNPNSVAKGQLELSPTPIVNSQVQLNLNSAFNDEAQLNPNLCVNDLNSNPAVNSQLELNRTANGVGNPNLSSSPAVNRQLNLNSAFNDEAQLNPNLCVNDLNSNPAVNSQLELNRTANGVGNPTLSSSPAVNRQLDETTANQVGNPGFFGSGSYHMEDDAPDDEQSWSLEEQGGDQQMLNSEFNNNIFQSDDFSTLFDQQLPTQEGDDDFLNALMAFGDY